MTPARLRECLRTLGWSQSGMAKAIGWSDSAGRSWATDGGMEIPADVAAWLEVRAKHAEAHPAPVRGKRG